MGEGQRPRPVSASVRSGVSFLLTLVAMIAVGALGGYMLGRYVFDRFLVGPRAPAAPAAPVSREAEPEPSPSSAPVQTAVPGPAAQPAAPGGLAARESPGPAPSGGSFFVQVGAFGSRERAGAMADRMRREGYAVVVQAQPGNPTLYKVLVGPYPRRDDAAQALQRIRASVPDAFIP